jgi:hypothetical protein
MRSSAWLASLFLRAGVRTVSEMGWTASKGFDRLPPPRSLFRIL